MDYVWVVWSYSSNFVVKEMNLIDYMLELGFSNSLSETSVYRLHNEMPVKVKLLGKRHVAITFPQRNCRKMDNVPIPRNIKHANILFRSLINDMEEDKILSSLNNYLKYMYGSQQLRPSEDTNNIRYNS